MKKSWIPISIGAFFGVLVTSLILPIEQIPGEVFLIFAFLAVGGAILASVLMKSSMMRSIENDSVQLPKENQITEADVLEITGAIPPVRAAYSVIKLLLCSFSSLKNYTLKSGSKEVGLRPSKTPVLKKESVSLTSFEKIIVDKQKDPLLLRAVLKGNPSREPHGALMQQYKEYCSSKRGAHFLCYFLPAACALGLMAAKMAYAVQNQKDAGILSTLMMFMVGGFVLYAFGGLRTLDDKCRKPFERALRNQYKPIKLHPEMLLLHSLADEEPRRRHYILLRMATDFKSAFSFMAKKEIGVEAIGAMKEEILNAEKQYRETHSNSDGGGCGCSGCSSGCGGCGGGCGGCGDD